MRVCVFKLVKGTWRRRVWTRTLRKSTFLSSFCSWYLNFLTMSELGGGS